MKLKTSMAERRPTGGSRDARVDRGALISWSSLTRFYGLAVLISWVAWTPVVLGRSGLGILPFTLPLLWVIPGSIGPVAAACIVQWQECRNFAIAQIRAPLRQAMIGTCSGLLVLSVAFVVGTAVVLTRGPPHGWMPAAFGLYGTGILTALIGGPIFEEWGWRGFAQARLQRRIGGLPAAVIIGIAWGVWHLPVFLVAGWSSASPVTFVAMMVALSVLIAWAFNFAGGSVITAILMHATFNQSSHVLAGFLGTASLRTGVDPVIAILLALSVTAIVIGVATRGGLGQSKDVSPESGTPESEADHQLL